MAEVGANLQNTNNELVKCIEGQGPLPGICVLPMHEQMVVEMRTAATKFIINAHNGSIFKDLFFIPAKVVLTETAQCRLTSGSGRNNTGEIGGRIVKEVCGLKWLGEDTGSGEQPCRPPFQLNNSRRTTVDVSWLVKNITHAYLPDSWRLVISLHLFVVLAELAETSITKDDGIPNRSLAFGSGLKSAKMSKEIIVKIGQCQVSESNRQPHQVCLF